MGPTPKQQPEPIASIECWIPTIQSAILIGQGAQIKLQTADDQIPAVAELAKNGRDKVLYITIFNAEDFGAG